MENQDFDMMRPFIRYAQLLFVDEKTCFENIAAYDYRMFFIREGEGIIIVDDERYYVKKGDVLVWSPGIKYSLLPGEGEGMEMIGISFDLCFSNSDMQIPIPPSNAECFVADKIVEKDVKKPEFLNTLLRCEGCHEMEFELFKIYTEYKNKLKFYEQKISGMFLGTLVQIARMSEQIDGAKEKSNCAEKIISLIRKDYNKPLTNKVIGETLGYHPNHVNRLVVMYTGMSLHAYLQNFRIEKAMDLLQMTDMSVMQICEAVGFKDFTHFSKYFKKKTGYTPTAFRVGRR